MKNDYNFWKLTFANLIRDASSSVALVALAVTTLEGSSCLRAPSSCTVGCRVFGMLDLNEEEERPSQDKSVSARIVSVDKNKNKNLRGNQIDS